MTFIGYARTSRKDQSLDLQIDALLQGGCFRHNIYADRLSGSHEERPAYKECIASLKKGDVLVVWRVDRLGRSSQHLISVITELRQKGVQFKSLQEGLIDTTSANGELMFHMFATLANFERNLLIERTRAGVAAARARGRIGGRKVITDKDPKVQAVKSMTREGKMSISEICSSLQISRATFYRHLKLGTEI